MSDSTWAATSRIEQVTVFRLGAEVQRAAELTAPASYPAELRVPGLPLQLRDDTVQLSVRPLDGAAQDSCPLAVDLKLALAPPPEDPGLPPASDAELRQAQHQVVVRNTTLQRLSTQLASLESLTSPERAEPAEGEPPAPSPTAGRLELLAFRRQLQDKLQDQVELAREQHRLASEALGRLEASREQREVQRQLDPHELRKEARVTLHAPAGTESAAARFTLVISYLVPAARWAPAYALQLQPDGGSATLRMRAQVCQKTGEDWEGVRLHLSTADALQWTDLPQLHPQRIGRAQASLPTSGWRPPPRGAQEMYGDYLSAKARYEEDLMVGAAPARPTRRPAPPPPQPACEPELDESPDEECMELDCAAVEQQPRRRAKRGRPASPKARGANVHFQAMAGAAPVSASMPAAVLEAQDSPTGAVSFGASASQPPDTGRELLDYDALRMAAASEPERGKLRPATDHQRYLELLPETQRRRVPTPGAMTRHVRSLVSELEGRALPTGHRPPARLDAFDHCWHGEGVVDIPGDAWFHAVPVLTCPARASIHHVTVPRESQEVFRILSMANPLPGPLLAGPVDVRMGDDYLLTAALDSVPSGGDIELGLGVEESIRVARNTRYAEQQRGMVSRHLELEHQLQIELRNLLPGTAQVEVRERIPIHREDDEEISISVREVRPAWEPWEQPKAPIRGAYRWKLDLQPGQVRQLRATYSVSIAAKHELVGGNRREEPS